MRAEARGPSAMLTMSTPPAASSRTCLVVAVRSMPVGAVSSTEIANSPVAIRDPRRLRPASGCTAGRAGSRSTVIEPLRVVIEPPCSGRAVAGSAASRRSTLPPPIIRIAPSIARVCSGVVPQQPPIERTPLLSNRRANTPKCSGLAT